MKNKIILVPHTHWDREWYFTYDTSNVLLQNNIKELLNNINDQKMFIDGQWSLIDDYLKWNPNDKQKIQKLLLNNNIACGPLYAQPDVFSSQAETTLRNFEMGQNVADKLGIKQSNTAYLPDTFGFNANIPQIFKISGIDNFVAWRGVPEHVLEKSTLFNWEGVDGSKLKAYCLQEGYYSLGQYYPYNGLKYYPEKSDPKYFYQKLMKRIKNLKVKDNTVILPLGGDQAPFMHDQVNFLKKVNMLDENIDIQLMSDYDEFFKKIDFNNYNENIYKGVLRTALKSKIHITIASSRYDIKKSFRNAEDWLFYLLEPLEIYYSQYDKKYDFETYKNENILKPLMLAQAHDSLGGCNTDITNEFQLHRINRIQQNITSTIDLLMKKLIQEKNIPDEQLVIFNPAPFNNYLFEKRTIYSSVNKVINIANENIVIQTYNSQNIAWGDKPLYKQDVLIFKDNIKNFSFNNINISHNKNQIIKNNKSDDSITVNKDKINLKFKKNNVNISFNLLEDAGDSYDFSPGEQYKFTQIHKIEEIKQLNKRYVYVKITTKIKEYNSEFAWDVVINKSVGTFKTQIKTFNNLKSKRVSLIIENLSGVARKSQNLSITPFENGGSKANWKAKFSEFPADVDVNDGIIQKGNFSIITQGTNEFYDHPNHIELTLYRANGLVTRGDMKWRPSTSGLSWKEPANHAQLQKELIIDLSFTFGNPLKEYNAFKFTPYSYKTQQRNFIANKMTKFVINNILNPQEKLVDIKFNHQDCIISSLRLKNKKPTIRVSNPYDRKVSIDNHTLLPYKIKELEIY